MNYHGPLFGKLGRRHIPLKMTSEDVDRLERELALAQSANSDVARIAQERDEAREELRVANEKITELFAHSKQFYERAMETGRQLAESRAQAERLAEALRRKANPLPDGLPPLPDGAVYLGKGGEFKVNNPFGGWLLGRYEPFVWHFSNWNSGQSELSHYAAPADSGIARLNGKGGEQ
jgi:hypothetical protein